MIHPLSHRDGTHRDFAERIVDTVLRGFAPKKTVARR